MRDRSHSQINLIQEKDQQVQIFLVQICFHAKDLQLYPNNLIIHPISIILIESKIMIVKY